MTERGVRFFRNGTVLALSALLMRTVSVSFGAYVTGKIGPEGMGLYSLIMSVYTFAVTFATSGVQLATTRLVAEAAGQGDLAGMRAALRTALLYALSFGAVGSVVLFAGSGFFGRVLLGDGRTVPALRLLSVALVPVALSSVFSGYFTAVRRPSRSAAVSVVEQGIRIILTVFALTALLPKGMTYACLALVGGSAIAEILSAIIHGTLYAIDVRRLRKGASGGLALRPLLEITLPIAASSYVRSGLVSAEHMLIPRALSKGTASREEAVAAYGTLSGMALPIALYPMAVLSAFAGLLVPELAEDAAKGRTASNRRLAERTFTLTLWFGIAVGGVMAAGATALSDAVYGSPEAGRYLALLAPILPVMYLDHVTDVMLKGLGRQVYTMGVNILDSLLSILLVVLLLPHLGAMGYVLVILIAEVFNFGLSISGLRAALDFRFPFLRAVLLPLASVLLSVALSRRLVPAGGIPMLILFCLVALLLYAGILALLLFLFDGRTLRSHRCRIQNPLDKTPDIGYNICICGRDRESAGKGE